MKNIWILILVLPLLISCSKQNPNEVQGYIEGSYTYLSSPIAGRLEKISVSRGTQVRKGELIFKLESEPEASQLQEAQGKLQQARQSLYDMLKGKRPEVIAQLLAQRDQVMAQLNLDRKTLRRYRNLYKTGAIDKASVDQATAAYQTDNKKIKEINANLAEAKLGARLNQVLAQQAVVKAAEAAVKVAAWSLQQKTVAAPFNGQIFDTYYGVGEYVLAGHPVASVLTPADKKLIFFIPETTLSRIKIGQKVVIHCDGCGKDYSATINYISSKSEYTPPVIYSESSREKLVYRAEAKIPPLQAVTLHVGQPVDVTL